MILERPFVLFIFPASFLAIALIFASFQVSLKMPVPENFDDQPLATISTVEGRVELSRHHTSFSGQLPKGQKLEVSLYNFDKVQTYFGSNTTVQFLDGFELIFSPRSLFVIEQWAPEENQGPIYINLIAGNFHVKKKGRAGSLFIVQRGIVFDPNHKPKSRRRFLSLNSAMYFSSDVASQDKAKESQAKPQISSPPSQSLLRSLSNEYIDETIAKHQDQLIRCQSHALRSDKNSTGQLLVGISIDPRGKMKDVKILASDIENGDLQKCVQSVLLRTRFRPFSGPEIVRSYPLIFE